MDGWMDEVVHKLMDDDKTMAQEIERFQAN